MEYYARSAESFLCTAGTYLTDRCRSCYANGSLSFVFMPISQNNRNILHSVGQAATFTVANRPPQANNARVALMGNVTVMYPDYGGNGEVVQAAIDNIEQCFLERHPDSKWWIPGRKPAHTVCGKLWRYASHMLLISLSQGVLGPVRPPCEFRLHLCGLS
jgi:hypothetical protein